MRYLKITIASAIGISILILLYSTLDFGAVWLSISQVSPAWVAISVGLQVLLILMRAWRLKFMLRPSKASVRFSSIFWASSVGFMVNFLFPIRIGSELVRAYLIGKAERIPFLKVLTAVGLERVLDLVAISSLGLLSVAFLPSNTVSQLHLLSIALVSIISLTILAVVVVGTRKEVLVLDVVEGLSRRLPLLSRYRKGIRETFASAITGARALNHQKSTGIMTLLLTALIWISEFLSIFAFFIAFKIDLSPFPILLGSMLLQLLFILPSPPGYVGTGQAFWLIVFASFVNVETIIAMSILRQIITALILVGLGYVGLISMGMAFKDLGQLLGKVRHSSRSETAKVESAH